jgi:hypothetical protein
MRRLSCSTLASAQPQRAFPLCRTSAAIANIGNIRRENDELDDSILCRPKVTKACLERAERPVLSVPKGNDGDDPVSGVVCLADAAAKRRETEEIRSESIFFETGGTGAKLRALCASDSDLLPPRSRYPLKWARTRQPSPPPVANPGPRLSGPLHLLPLMPRFSPPAPRASG